MKKVNLLIIGLIIYSSCVQRQDGEAQTTFPSKVVCVTDSEYNDGVQKLLTFMEVFAIDIQYFY